MARQVASKVYANFTGGLVTESNPLQAPDNAVVDINNFDIKMDGSIEARPGLEFIEANDISVPSELSMLTTAIAVFKWEAVNGDPLNNIAVVQIGDVLRFYNIVEGEIDTSVEAFPEYQLENTIRSTDSTVDKRRSSQIQVASGGGRLYIVGRYIDPRVFTYDDSTSTLSSEAINIKIRDFKIAEEGQTISGLKYDNPNSVVGSRPWLSFPYNSNAELSLSGEANQQYISGAHAYNLINQGWPESDVGGEDIDLGLFGLVGYSYLGKTKTIASKDPNGTPTDAYVSRSTLLTTDLYRQPNVYETPHEFQNGGGTTVDKQKAFQPNFMVTSYTGNTIAPRGHLIKDAFYIQRRAAGMPPEIWGSHLYVDELYSFYQTNFPDMLDNLYYDETEECRTRPDTIAFYAGRVWYSGQEGKGFSRNIYFSQVVGDDTAKASKCYQAADPTAEDINELIATDGGVLSIEGMGKVLKLITVGASLLVVTDTGVWAISGDTEGANFTATNYSVRKLTSQGAANSKTIVEAGDFVMYWGDTSINIAAYDSLGTISIQDASSGKIRSLYASIKDKVNFAGFSKFDTISGRVLWFYQDVSSVLVNKTKYVNKVLIFDTKTAAYSLYTLGTTENTMPISIMDTKESQQFFEVDIVTDGGAVVTDGIEEVTDTKEIVIPGAISSRLLTLVNVEGDWKLRFSAFSDVSTFSDWGVAYSAHFEAGFDSLEDVIEKSKKAPVFVAHLRRTEDGFEINPDDPDEEELILSNRSSCKVSYNWNYGSDAYSNSFEAYKILNNYIPANEVDPFSYRRDVITSRTRLRGRGYSLGIRVDNTPGLNMKLLGYGVVFTVRGRL